MPSRVISDGNLAFMPSSNDALHSAANLQSPPFASSQSLSFHPPRSSASSPSRVALPQDSLDAMASISPHSGLRSREQSATRANAMSPSACAATSPRDDSDWHEMYNQATILHEKERSLWRMERQKLMEEIEQLKLQVIANGSARSIPGVAATAAVANSQSAAFYNPGIVKQANEKLRQFSQVSPGSTPNGEEAGPPSLSGTLSRKTSTQQRLPRIAEKGESRPSSFPRASFALQDETIDVPLASPGKVIIDHAEDPYSPPPTAHADALSPPPENFVRHAGHTPRPRSAHGSEAPQAAPVILASDGVDEDRELASPKVLASTPEGDLSTLSLLDKRLQSIAENPDDSEHQPDVVRTAMAEDVFGQPASAPAVISTEPDGGIRLKTKRSMNFGAPLGHR